MGKKHLSPFIAGKYKGGRDVVKAYHLQAAEFLSNIYGYDKDFILELIKEVFVPRENGFKEAKFKVLKKNKYGDRVPVVMYAREFFEECREKNYHLSPSLIAYKNAEEEMSVNSFATGRFIDFRNLYKDKRTSVPRSSELWSAYNEIQNALKIFNNAQSGGMSSSGTPLNNKSGHTSLTSMCRSLTSTANLLNERLITGNRLLLNYDMSMQLFIGTLAFSNKKAFKEAIKEFNMNHATTEQVMDMVRRCSRYYHNDKVGVRAIERFVDNLKPLEKTILLCTLDINGLCTTNFEVMKEYFDDWCHIPEFPSDVEELELPEPPNGDYKVLCVTMLGNDATPGKIRYLNRYHRSLEKKWEKLILAFFRCSIPPSNVFSIKDMVRENVLTSDTDSCIYSVDQLADKFIGGKITPIVFNGVLTYHIRNIAIDQHARLSTNVNISDRFLYRNNMSNEYLYSSYVTTSMAKHYYAFQLMCEGVINDALVIEQKGVNIRGANIVAKIREFSDKLMVDALNAVYDKKKLNAPQLLKEVADIERELMKDLEEGGYTWLTRATIKDGEVYSNPESSVFYYHKFWEECFASKYMRAPDLPYRAYKVKLTTSTRGKLAEALGGIEDRDIATMIERFTTGRGKLDLMYVPADIIDEIGGVPKEVIPFIDIRGIVAENLRTVYLVLDSLGIQTINDKATRLISDEH